MYHTKREGKNLNEKHCMLLYVHIHSSFFVAVPFHFIDTGVSEWGKRYMQCEQLAKLFEKRGSMNSINPLEGHTF
jgi:hypothetical protein